jgi:tetratricopeptide (TPR) repeat protein
VSSSAAVSERPLLERPAGAQLEPVNRRLLQLSSSLSVATVLLAAVMCWITFSARGGLDLEAMTHLEVRLTIGAAIVVIVAALLTPAGRALHGVWAVGLLVAFALLSAISVVWSVQPDNSWQDGARLLAYCGVFAAAVALVRLAPSRWPAVLGGVALATVTVCGYALLTKIYPATFDASETFARLQEPIGYWNAIGLAAGMGAIACMWLGARRSGHALLSVLAYPALTLLLVTSMLAYSRGALAALALGLILWFVLVPLRLRGAVLLIISSVGAVIVVAWDFSRHALTADNVPLAERVAAGHELGVLVVVVLILVGAAGLLIAFSTARRAPRPDARQRAGALLISLLVACVLAAVGVVAASHRGLAGNVSDGFNSLTDIHKTVATNSPSRLTALASVRAAYWNQALEIFRDHPVFGVGARGYETAQLHYREGTLEAKNAHGYIVQTLADLGLVGLLVTLALLAAWLAAAARATRPLDLRLGRRGFSRESQPYGAERIGMLSMLCLVVVFGVHSFVDWTWYVPGTACVALFCAGWLAGRGPPSASCSEAPTLVIPGGVHAARKPPAWRAPTRADLRSTRAVLIACVLVATGLAVWAQSQPQRSVDAANQALDLLASHHLPAARAAAERAVSRDPLSVTALFTLAAVQQSSGKRQLTRATLQQAVRLQPSNPQTWLSLGRFDLASDPTAALTELRAAIYLNPESIAPSLIAQGNPEAVEIQNDFVLALRAAGKVSARKARVAKPVHARAKPARRASPSQRLRIQSLLHSAQAAGRASSSPRSRIQSLLRSLKRSATPGH